MKSLWCVLLLFSTNFALLAQNNAERYRLRAQKAVGAIHLDGNLNEQAWQTSAEKADHFKLCFPNDTAYSKWPTEVRITFDDRNLYVGAVCWEKRSDYTVQSMRRDFGGGTTDVFNIMLEPNKDGQNGFIFSVSPLNVQREGIISTGEAMALEWDNKWNSAVQTFEDHWTVEMAIPFKTLRYNVSEGENSWGLQFIRTKIIDFESSTWAPVPFQFSNTNLSFAGRLIWDTPPPKPGANISLIPYAISSASIDYLRDANTLKIKDRPTTLTGAIGGDAKIGLTPGLNLDLTINPDFSQVEVDRQVPNLSRFELFFPEIRQFFLENRDLFAMFGFPDTRPFFSRRVGLAYNPVTGQNEKVPIIAGARLSGKVTDGLRVGLLNMQTRQRDWDSTSVLPAANFSVATLQQKIFARSTISGVFVNKQNFLEPLNENQKSGWQPWNRVAGLEYNLYSADNRWEGEAYYHRSFSPEKSKNGSTAAVF
ncbi:MAG: carbohydrate binding family 9 domain-containing protein, partial [Saprospiraceae bacterium]|nr:carbohydrate binding family 9 domain-containing protein [Saprospiraceae bacterium]